MELNEEFGSNLIENATRIDSVEGGQHPPTLPPPRRGDEGCTDGSLAVYDGSSVPESLSPVNDAPLISFSLDAIRQLVQKRDDLRRQYEDASRKVDALSVLLSDDVRASVFGSAVTSVQPTLIPEVGVVVKSALEKPAYAPPLRDFVIGVLDSSLELMSQDDVENAVWESQYFSDKAKITPELIGRALENASRKGRIGKRGLNYFSRQMSEVPGGDFRADGPTIINAVEKILREAGESLEPWEIVERLRQDDEVGERVRSNSNGVYAALSRLTSRRIAYRDADGYRIGAK